MTFDSHGCEIICEIQVSVIFGGKAAGPVVRAPD